MTKNNTTRGANIPDLRKRVHMVQGQLEAIVRMIDEGVDCVEVLTQFKAARAGLDRTLALFLQENLKRCVGGKELSAPRKAELENIISELVK